MKKILLILLFLFFLKTNVLALESNNFIIWKIISPNFYLDNDSIKDELLEPLNWNGIYLTNVYLLDNNLKKIDSNIIKKLKDTTNYDIWSIIVFYWDLDYINIKNLISKYIWLENKIVWWRWKTTSLTESSYYLKCNNDVFNLEKIYGNFEKKQRDFLLNKVKNKFHICSNFRKEFWLINLSYKKENNYDKYFSKYYKLISKKYWYKIKKISLDKKLKLFLKIDKLRKKIDINNLSKEKKIKINILLDALIKILADNINNN